MKLTLLLEGTLADRGWAAAVRTPSSPTFTASCHHDAWFEYYDAMTDLDDDDIIEKIVAHHHPKDWEEGFLSPEGWFFSREDALTRWRSEAGVATRGKGKPRGRNWGDSNDLELHNQQLVGAV